CASICACQAWAKLRRATFASLGTHSQLVAEVARRSFAHAWQAQMLAQCCCRLHIEVIERNNAINILRPRHVTDAKQHILDLPLLVYVRDVEGLVNALARPPLIG